MKAEAVHQRRLLDLQELDTTLAQMNHRARTLPEIAELERLDARIAELRNALVVVETELGDLGREQRKAEADVDQVRTRAERDSRRLEAGQVSSPKELEGLQSEIASLQRRQGELEEIVLDVMERRETAEARRAELAKDLATAEQDRAVTEERRSTEISAIRADAATARDRRTRVAGEIPDDLLALYTKLRDQYGGVAAAPLRYGRCEGCKLALSTAELGEIRAALSDEVVRCENCRRILIRTTESGL
ncbi:zinc ribbon domain-containing protein [Marinactinospora rubrisoli]|uniref:Zinc ribbon domain-containing protein n=1 Tax=Marinactinospora rubrisoli TaxID=2715399 RepID=A0ABW2KBQ4_9ACTN